MEQSTIAPRCISVDFRLTPTAGHKYQFLPSPAQFLPTLLPSSHANGSGHFLGKRARIIA